MSSPGGGVGEEGAGLAVKVKSSLLWSLANTGVTRAGTTVMGIVVARILDPRDFGVFAVAMVVYNGILSINDMGAGLAIVRWPNFERIETTAATMSIASSAALYAISFVAAPPLARALGSPGAANIIRVLCIGVVVDGLIAVPTARLQRDFRQGRQAVIDQINFAVGAVATITMALSGWGPWSLAWGRLLGNLTTILMIVVLVPRPFKLGFDRTQFRPLLRFGAPLVAASGLVFAVLNVDYIVVGTMLGPVSLGVYVLAFNLSSWPVNVLSTTVRRVSFAGFARLQDDQGHLHRSLAEAVRTLTMVTVPVSVALAVLARPAIHVVYGSKWLEGAPVLAYLAVLGGCRVLFELFYDYLAAAGRPRVCMWVQGVWLGGLTVTLTLAAKLDGTVGVSFGHVLVAVAIVTPAFAVALRRSGVDLLQLAKALVRPLLSGAVAAAAALVVAHTVHGDLPRLVAGSATVGVVCLVGAVPLIRVHVLHRSGDLEPVA